MCLGLPMMSGWPPAVWTTPLSFGMLANSQVDNIGQRSSQSHSSGFNTFLCDLLCIQKDNSVCSSAFFFLEMVTCLRGHTGLVKGLTWDPVGKYIASQADDHSLRVWRTVDWQMEANITKPFSEVNKAHLLSG